MTAALEGVSVQQHAPATRYLRKRPVTHNTGGWMRPTAGLDGGKSRLHWDSISESPPRCQWPYRLSYSAHDIEQTYVIFVVVGRFTDTDRSIS